MQYDDVEGVLYGLGARTEPRYSRPTVGPRRGVPGPGSLSPAAERRVDVSHAVSQLTTAERQMVLEHYVTGARVWPPRSRRPVVKKLLAALRGG